MSYRCIPHRMPFEADEPFSLLLITDFLYLFYQIVNKNELFIRVSQKCFKIRKKIIFYCLEARMIPLWS